MTTTEHSLYEREQLARINATPAAPESWDSDAAVRRVLAAMAAAEDQIRASTPPVTAERLIAEGEAPTVTVAALRAALEPPR